MTQDELFAVIQSEVKVYCDRFKGRYEVYPEKKVHLIELARFFAKYNDKYEWDGDLLSFDPSYSKDAVIRICGDYISFHGQLLLEFRQLVSVIDEIDVSCTKDRFGGCLDVKFIIKDFWKEV